MAEERSVKDYVVGFSNCDLPLMECCFCRDSLRDPVMLKCLHNCCRSCLESSGTAETQSQASGAVTCPACSEATEPRAAVANGLLDAYQRVSALYSDAVCCSACDEQQVSAEFWCADCCMGLCATCYSWHNRFNGRHRSTELEVARTWSVSQLTPAGQCSLHRRQMEVQCFTCQQPKCLLCYESCRGDEHDARPLSHDATRKFVFNVIDAIRSATVRLSRLLSGLQPKGRAVTSGILEARRNCGVTLSRRKRLLQDSVERAFNRSLTELCANLHRVWYECTRVVARPSSLSATAASVARHIGLVAVTCVPVGYLLRQRHVPRTVVRGCVSSCRDSFDRLLGYWQESGTFVVDSTAPLSADIVLSGCLGVTERRRAAPAAPLLFGQVSRSFRTTVDCSDLAVTRDGHVLLAASEHGMLVYSEHGQQLSSWQPTKLSDGQNDWVWSVASLSEGRAAVGVAVAQLVALLRRSNETDDSWQEDCILTAMQSPPRRIAVHGDLLAAAESTLDAERQDWVAGRHVQLLRMSSRELLYRQSREYNILGVALTALCIITTTRDRMKRNSGLMPFFVEAHSHAGEFIWRHETSDEEGVMSVCAAETWCRVYLSMVSSDRSCRVMAIGGADGRDNSDVLTSRTHGLQDPITLSLSRGQTRTVLAVLSADRIARQIRTVTMYEATSV